MLLEDEVAGNLLAMETCDELFLAWREAGPKLLHSLTYSNFILSQKYIPRRCAAQVEQVRQDESNVSTFELTWVV